MDYLTAEEIAAMLRVDTATVRRWIRTGDLAGVQVGRQYRVERADYEAFVKSRKVKSDPKNSGLMLAH